jgi:hypothetical protein
MPLLLLHKQQLKPLVKQLMPLLLLAPQPCKLLVMPPEPPPMLQLAPLKLPVMPPVLQLKPLAPLLHKLLMLPARPLALLLTLPLPLQKTLLLAPCKPLVTPHNKLPMPPRTKPKKSRKTASNRTQARPRKRARSSPFSFLGRAVPPAAETPCGNPRGRDRSLGLVAEHPCAFTSVSKMTIDRWF